MMDGQREKRERSVSGLGKGIDGGVSHMDHERGAGGCGGTATPISLPFSLSLSTSSGLTLELDSSASLIQWRVAAAACGGDPDHSDAETGTHEELDLL
jgi:hypothetical protein